MSNQAAEILIVDDHEAIRSGIRMLLSARPEWHVCGEAVDGVDAVEKVKELKPDVVLMDVTMPRMDGLTAMRIVQKESPDAGVIIVTQNDASSLRQESTTADGYVLKVHLHRDLIPTIEKVLDHGHNGHNGHNGKHGHEAPTPHIAPPAPRPEVTPIAAETLRPQSAGLLAAIVNHTDDAVISNDLNGIVMSWNEGAERLFGYTADEMLGQSIMRIVPVDHQSEERDIIARIRAGERVPHFEATRVRKDGSEVAVSVTISPVKDEGGRTVGASIVTREVTGDHSLESAVHTRTRDLERRNAEIVEQSEQLQELSSRLQQGQDEERHRIARALHDSAGQLVAVLRMNLDMLRQHCTGESTTKPIESSEQIVEQLDREIRAMSYLLHPPLLDESGLSSALRWYARGLSERAGLEIVLDVADDFGRVPFDMELALFRIVEECLSNIHRHSGSKTAAIRLFQRVNRVFLGVADEGHGMPGATLAGLHRQKAGVGIAGMRERVRHFGGVMNIESDEHGTRVSVELPIPGGDPSPAGRHDPS